MGHFLQPQLFDICIHRRDEKVAESCKDQEIQAIKHWIVVQLLTQSAV